MDGPGFFLITNQYFSVFVHNLVEIDYFLSISTMMMDKIIFVAKGWIINVWIMRYD